MPLSGTSVSSPPDTSSVHSFPSPLRTSDEPSRVQFGASRRTSSVVYTSSDSPVTDAIQTSQRWPG